MEFKSWRQLFDAGGEITEFRAAQYVRMSTEHQQYSTHNQSDKIREYAEKRGIEIIKTYTDDGKSGLSIGDRSAPRTYLHPRPIATGSGLWLGPMR